MVEDERLKLKTLLGYWIEHNNEHGQEFREWAQKALSLGEPAAGEDLVAAADEMDTVNKLLSRARRRVAEK